MLDDFYVRALIVGVMVAVLAAPFGCFVVWRRMAYFGDTMAHSALLGITLSLLLEIHTGIGVFAIALLSALASAGDWPVNWRWCRCVVLSVR